MMKMNFKFLKKRGFKHGSLATIVTVVFIAVIVILNVIATMLLERYPLTIDMTTEQRFALTDESIDFVKAMGSDVKITVCADETVFKGVNDLYRQAYEIISNYTKYNNDIELNFVDLVKNPTFSQGYPNMTLIEGDVIVESPLRSKKLAGNDLFMQQQTEQGGVIYSSKAEQAMTSALTFVTDANPSQVSILGGLDNVDVSGYTTLLEQNNFSVKNQDFLVEEIDPESDFVVLAAPSSDISADQVKKLNTYLDNDGKFGKGLVYIASSIAPPGKLLKSFLGEWGIDPGPEVIFETDTAFAVGDNLTLVSQLKSDAIANQLKSKKLPLVIPYSNPLNVLFEAKENRKTEVIASSSDAGVLFPVDEAAAAAFDPNKQEKKAYPTIVKATRDKYEGTTLLRSTVLAFGSSDMFSKHVYFGEFLQNPSFNNADVTMTLTNELVKKEDTIKILPVTFTNETITITQQQSTVAFWVFMAVIPLAVLAIGAVIWFRRRHL